MNKTFTQINHVGPGAWEYIWAAGTPPYRILENSIIVSESYTETTYIVHGDDIDEPPVLEVCDYGETVSSELYPQTAIMQWFGDPRSTGYNIYIDDIIYDSVVEIGAGYYQYSGFGAQVDGTQLNVTLTQYDSLGNETASIPFTWLIFKHPAPPLVDYECVAGEISVNARS